MLACRKYSLPLSVNILHLEVCIFDITEPSSILRNPVILAPSSSVSVLLPFDASAKTGLAYIPWIIAGQYWHHCQNRCQKIIIAKAPKKVGAIIK